MANKLMRGLGKLAKGIGIGIGYTLAVILAATVISGLLVGLIGTAAAGWVFLGLLGAGTFTAVKAAAGRSKAKKARQRDQDLTDFVAAEEGFSQSYKNGLENRFSDPAQRQAFYKQQLEMQNKSREDAGRQREVEAEEIKRQERLSERQQQQGSSRSRKGSGFERDGLTDRFQSATGPGGGQGSYDGSKAADDARRRQDDERQRQQRDQIIEMMSPNR